MTRVDRKLKALASALLVLGAFFNPLGFDALWALVQHWTHSYWCTSLIFYSLSAACFLLHWLVQRRIKRSITK